MKYTVLLIFWMFFSLLLACSFIGLLLFIPKDTWQNHENTPSTWMTIGRTLLSKI